MDNLMGEKIRLLISQNGISQKELAKNAGITESAISHYISGNRVPKGAILLKIAKTLGTTTDFLLAMSETEKNLSNSNDDIDVSYRLLARNAKQISFEQKQKFLKLLLQGE